MKINPAQFERAIKAVDEKAPREAAVEFFDPSRHAGAFVKN